MLQLQNFVRAVVFGLGTPVALSAQLTLADALRRADAGATANRLAAGNTAATSAQRLMTLRGVLPTVRVEGGYLRTTDPIDAFGTRLKQRELAEADFDPRRLNFPNAVGNYTGAVVAEQPLINADGWMARRATAHAANASASAAEWTRLSTRVDVIRAYFGAVLATEQIAVLEAASTAAQAHVRQAEAMVRAGMATKSDALLAAVKAGDVEAQRVEAESNAAIARRQLALLIGRGTSSDTVLPPRLPSSAAVRRLALDDTLDALSNARADVEAARMSADAARADVQRARSTYLPRLNAFARYDWNSPQRVYGGERSWTLGVLASWSLFDGASQLAETQAASARLEIATAAASGAVDLARLETERALFTLRSALVRLELAERSVTQSAEAHRIVTRKYEGGLATVAELLDAAAVETQSDLAFSNARFATIVATAERRRALGRDPGTLTQLENGAVATGATRGSLGEIPR